MRRIGLISAVSILCGLAAMYAIAPAALTSNVDYGTMGTVSSAIPIPTTIECDGAAVLYIEMQFAGVATAEVDQQLKTNGTYTPNFNLVQGTSGSNAVIWKITDPGGIFRCNVTADGGANAVTCNWQCVWRKLDAQTH